MAIMEPKNRITIILISLTCDRTETGEGTMKSESEIKRDVEAELQWTPGLDTTDIAVAVKDGVVTLTGFVRNYGHKLQAEKAAKRVAGVVGVANDIEIRLPGI